eukprot:scaffold237978_cov22-Prasinocladus_malaysianus.AAC.1
MQMFNRPGPRLIDALEFLTGLLNDQYDLISKQFPWKARPLDADSHATCQWWVRDKSSVNGSNGPATSSSASE